jgi:Holliday junction resolvasome RuvABC endonuclease subunit
MIYSLGSLTRILAIDPISRGFGFAVLEGPERLIDWGVVHVRTDKHAGCLRRIASLVESHQPTVIVTEDISVNRPRRSARVALLIAAIRELASDRGIRFNAIPRAKVRRFFSETGKATKRDISVAIAGRFPELRPYLPPRRKCYMSEDERTAIFDAVALGLTLLRTPSNTRTRPPWKSP